MTRRRILFVCRASSTESSRSAQAIAGLDNTDVVTTDVSGVEQLLEIARTLRNEHGCLERIVTAQETLLETVASANEALGLPGLSVAAVRRTLDKLQLKSTLKAAGIDTPRYEIVHGLIGAKEFVAAVGWPIILKSVVGSGGLATLLINSDGDLQNALELADHVLLAEQHISGQELCIDTITIDSEPQFYSICCYQPSILAAVEHPDTQWACVMPRDLTSYGTFIEQGLKAIRALNVGNAMTHMEGFIDPHGQVWFTDATLRPAGARIAPMLAFAYNFDPYRAWARVAVDGCFDGPWERKYAVGTIFLRGVGAGAVKSVEGIEMVQRELGDLLTEMRTPRIGAQKSATYTGDGFITLRHPETDVVQSALRRIAEVVRITYSSNAAPAGQTWGSRLQNFQELNRPVWDISSEFNL